MNELDEKLQQLINSLSALHSEQISHEQRKGLLLSLHQLKVAARKEQHDGLTNELVALEYSLGFGQEQQDIHIADIHEHVQRLKVLAGHEHVDDDETAAGETDVDAELPDESREQVEEPDAVEMTETAEITADEFDEAEAQMELISTAPLHLTLCNCKTRDEARDIAYGLMNNRFAACVNFIANIGSIYRWEGEVVDGSECQLQIKSVPARDEDIRNYIKAHHSYDVPEIITVPIHQADNDYVQWVIQETTT